MNDTTNITAEPTAVQLVHRYNVAVARAAALGFNHRPVKCFHDKPTALERIAQVELVVARGVRADETEGKVLPVSPGRARLLNSGRAEEIREAVVADQERATSAAAARTTEQEGTEMAKKTGARKEKKEKTNGGETNGRGRRGRFTDEMKITVLADKNPKREGTRSADVFGCYRDGITVGKFVERVMALDGGTRGEAVGNLNWDTKKEFISVA